MSTEKTTQTHFVHTVSPAHVGKQSFLHQDIHVHLAKPDGSFVGSPIAQVNHVPLMGQTTLPDFSLQTINGLPPIIPSLPPIIPSLPPIIPSLPSLF